MRRRELLRRSFGAALAAGLAACARSVSRPELDLWTLQLAPKFSGLHMRTGFRRMIGLLAVIVGYTSPRDMSHNRLLI